MPKITRKLEFDAGHRILGHEGKCAHLHGHRYVAEITVSGRDLDTLGRVVDFSVVKTKVGGWIDDYWDHNILLHPQDPLLRALVPDYDVSWAAYITDLEPSSELIPPAVLGGEPTVSGLTNEPIFGKRSPYVMPEGQNPTAEVMAEVLFTVAQKILGGGLLVEHVRMYETPNCWADYSLDEYQTSSRQ